MKRIIIYLIKNLGSKSEKTEELSNETVITNENE